MYWEHECYLLFGLFGLMCITAVCVVVSPAWIPENPIGGESPDWLSVCRARRNDRTFFLWACLSVWVLHAGVMSTRLLDAGIRTQWGSLWAFSALFGAGILFAWAYYSYLVGRGIIKRLGEASNQIQPF